MSESPRRHDRIAVFGANGQVGLEVCLFLSEWTGVEVVPVCRAEHGSTVLRRLGLKCRHGRLTDDQCAAELMSGASLVADFGWPTNAVGRLRSITRQIQNAVRLAPAGAPYVFISTQSVYRLDPATPGFSAYRLSKLLAERVARREGKKAGRPVFILRLGEVHGPLQRVSKGTIDGFRAQTAVVPTLSSYTVFTYSIAEALVNIARGRERPDTYTVMSAPEWSWPEVHAYYCRWTGIVSEAREEVVAPGSSSLWSRALAHAKAWVVAEVMRQKDLIEHWGMRLMPERVHQARLRHHRTTARSEVQRMMTHEVWRPYGQKVAVPGKRLASLSDVRASIFEKNRDLLARLQTVLFDSSSS